MMSGPQLWIVLGIILLLFGGSRLPKLARDLGRSQQEFKAGLEEGRKAAHEGDESADSASESSATPESDTKSAE